MGFRLQQKLMTLNDFERQFTIVRVMRIATKRPRLVSRGFCYKVALYLSYQHIKFDDEIRRESLRILSIIFHQPASEVKLTSRFLCIQTKSTFRYVRHMIRRPHTDG